jgi:hypothetical protein
MIYTNFKFILMSNVMKNEVNVQKSRSNATNESSSSCTEENQERANNTKHKTEVKIKFKQTDNHLEIKDCQGDHIKKEIELIDNVYLKSEGSEKFSEKSIKINDFPKGDLSEIKKVNNDFNTSFKIDLIDSNRGLVSLGSESNPSEKKEKITTYEEKGDHITMYEKPKKRRLGLSILIALLFTLIISFIVLYLLF